MAREQLVNGSFQILRWSEVWTQTLPLQDTNTVFKPFGVFVLQQGELSPRSAFRLLQVYHSLLFQYVLLQALNHQHSERSHSMRLPPLLVYLPKKYSKVWRSKGLILVSWRKNFPLLFFPFWLTLTQTLHEGFFLFFFQQFDSCNTAIKVHLVNHPGSFC